MFQRGWPLSGTASTQRFSDVSDGKNGKKASDARTNLKPGSFVFIELCYFIDRHLRFLSQELDGSLLMGSFAAIGVHTTSLPCMVCVLYSGYPHVLEDAVRYRT